MYRVINSNMAHGVREITIKRGLDPREFPMVVAGGAGAVHACMIAQELEIPSLLVPPTASVLCAAGMLFSDLKHDYVRTYICPFAEVDLARLRELVGEMREEGEAELRREGVAPDAIRHEVALDLRYVKQYHEVTLPVAPAAIEAGDVAAITAAFHAEHDRLYGYELSKEGTDLELINVRVRPVGRAEKPRLPELESGGTDPDSARKGVRRAYLPERMTFADVPVYDGHRLRAGNVVEGPALVERTDTTIFVTSGFVAGIDVHGSCRLERRAGEGDA